MLFPSRTEMRIDDSLARLVPLLECAYGKRNRSYAIQDHTRPNLEPYLMIQRSAGFLRPAVYREINSGQDTDEHHCHECQTPLTACQATWEPDDLNGN